VCAAKGFTVGLRQHDLRDLPLPYPDGFCNHVVSVAVLNSFPDLGGIFSEVRRLLQPNGLFAFTVEDQKPGQPDRYAINRVELTEQAQAESAVTLFRHPTAAVARIRGVRISRRESQRVFQSLCGPKNWPECLTLIGSRGMRSVADRRKIAW
jgi:SAM-dependent methyltransferase